MTKTFLTKEGYSQLAAELEELKSKREHLVTQIEEVAQPDETSEDGLATQLKEELEIVYTKIEQLEETLEMAEVINGSSPKSGLVQVGSVVKIKVSGDPIRKISIVSHMESDPSQNKISDQSPLGLALIGKKVNDQIEVTAPVGKITYKIVGIN